MIFQNVIFSWASRGLKATPGPSRQRQAPTLDRTPFHRRAHSHPRTPTGTCQLTSCAHLLLMGENQAPGENPRRYGENVQTPHRVAPAGKQFFFVILINVTTSEKTLNKTFLEDLLYHLKFHQAYLCVRWLFLFKLIIEILFRLFMWKR